MPPFRLPAAARALRWLVLLLPFTLFAVNLPRFGALQRNDYWGDFRPLLDGDRLTRQPLRWLQARSNEHRIALPLLLWTANIRLTHGDNRVLSLLSLVLLLATFACLWTLLPERVRGSPAASLGFGLPLAALVATPVAAHCWALGFSGNQWYFANLSAAAALACCARLRPESGRGALVAAVLLTLPGAFAHSTHLSLWPALVVLALLVPVPRYTAALCAGAATLYLSLFLWGYDVPTGHPVPGGETGSLASFVATYLSLRASSDVETARWWGAAGVALFVVAAWAVLRRPRAARGELAPWLVLAIYAGGNALGTSFARVDFGPQMALASRYASLPALFWIGTLGTLGLAALGVADRRRRLLALAGVGLATAALLTATTLTGTRVLRLQMRTAERQPLGALALRWRVRDQDAARTIGLSWRQLNLSRAFFERERHIPFDTAAEWPLGERWPAALPAGDAPAAGLWRKAASGPPGFLAVAGRARVPRGAGGRVLFLDADGVLRGGAVFVPEADAPLPPLLRARPPGRGWFGYLAARCAPRVRPYLEISERGATRLEPLALAPGVGPPLDALCAPALP